MNALNAVHSKQLGDLGQHLQSGVSSEEAEELKKELDMIKQEMEATNVILDDKKEKLQEEISLKNEISTELKDKLELCAHEIEEVKEDCISAKSQLAIATREIVELKTRLEDSDTISAADAKVIRDEYEVAKQSELNATAALDEAVFAREELNTEKDLLESGIKELRVETSNLHEMLEEEKRKHEKNLLSLAEEKEQAVEQAQGEAQVKIVELMREKSELKVVADKCVKAEKEVSERSEAQRAKRSEAKRALRMTRAATSTTKLTLYYSTQFV